MKQKLVVTLTTVHGSRQFTLGQLAKYAFALFLLLGAISFFVSNSLLVITQDNLSDLEQNHVQLQATFEEVAENQHLVEQENDELDAALTQLISERNTLAEQNQHFMSQVQRLATLEQEFSSLASERNVLMSELSSLSKQHQEMSETVARLTAIEQQFGLSGQGKTNAERVKDLHAVIEQRNFLLHQIPNGPPIDNPIVTGHFGYRKHPVQKKRKIHAGMDFRAKVGTPVYATADGIVEFGGYKKSSGFGKLIVIQHNYGFKTYFAHLSKVLVKGRTFVTKGQKIGYSGNTGRSTGPHLHYEIHHLYKRLDPKNFVSLSMVNINEFFSTVTSIQWGSLKKLYPLNQTAQPLQ